ncbi:hypothetical protein Pmani_028983 [Petrolisthes manimaculis]|uniref:Reverse transcriptase/retrotransposon-derived protein RNase H-like domain-containing protein n=1 Tax=Petrolisthes manimaculis TaxID=1843537 RepID=A0AAE1TXG4_9EUCA|nr:hypothetical protein Pmani_028983 [Petrolisthes manimaculis]
MEMTIHDSEEDVIIPSPGNSTNQHVLSNIQDHLSYLPKAKTNDVVSILKEVPDMTSSKRKFQWNPDCETAFQKLKLILMTEPVLRTPNYSLPFMLQIDASANGRALPIIVSNKLELVICKIHIDRWVRKRGHEAEEQGEVGGEEEGEEEEGGEEECGEEGGGEEEGGEEGGGEEEGGEEEGGEEGGGEEEGGGT